MDGGETVGRGIAPKARERACGDHNNSAGCLWSMITREETLRIATSEYLLSTDWLRLAGISQLHIHPYDPLIEIQVSVAGRNLG